MILTTASGRRKHWATTAAFPSVDLYITGRCNRRCSYCFLPAEYLDSRVMMNSQTFARAVTWASEHGVQEMTILGGEPSLHPELVSYLEAIRARGMRSRVVTNGSLPFRRAIAAGSVSRANVERVAVSLDTIDEKLQDLLRGPHAHSDAMQTVALLQDRSIPFDFNCTATRPVLRKLESLLDFADGAGARRVNVHWPSNMGLGRGLEPDDVPTRREWHDAVTAVERYRPARSALFVEIQRGFLDGSPFRGCALTGPSNIQIFPDGRAILCGLGSDRDDWPALHLGPEGLQTIAGPSYERELEARVRAGCASCPAIAEPGRACIYDRVGSASTDVSSARPMTSIA